MNITNKMLTHLTLLTTVMIYIMDNVTKIAELEKKQKNKKKYKKTRTNFTENSITPIINTLNKEQFTQKSSANKGCRQILS